MQMCRYQQREPHTRGQQVLYGQRMLTIASRLDVMNRLGRAMADPTRSRILMTLLEGPSYPAVLARDLGLTRSNVSNHRSEERRVGKQWRRRSTAGGRRK